MYPRNSIPDPSRTMRMSRSPLSVATKGVEPGLSGLSSGSTNGWSGSNETRGRKSLPGNLLPLEVPGREHLTRWGSVPGAADSARSVQEVHGIPEFAIQAFNPGGGLIDKHDWPFVLS